MRRLEVRIGELLGPVTRPGPSESSIVIEDVNKDQRHQFRQMAEHPEEVEAVIAEL